MKQILLTSMLLISSLSFGQETFQLRSNIGQQRIAFNGEEYEIDSVGITLKTHYPSFDTIQFQIDERDLDFVLCNFKPDSSYALISACCGSIDLTSTSRFDRLQRFVAANQDTLIALEPESEILLAQGFLIDQATFTFRLTESASDTVWGWSSDAACWPKIYPITTEPLYYGESNKCFYWTNINYLHFFKQDNLQYWEDDEGIKEYNLPDNETMETIASVAVRFFDNHHFLVTVNPKTNAVYLRYDD